MIYYNRINKLSISNWKSWINLEWCNISAIILLIILIFPKKFLFCCSLPIGIMGPIIAIFFGTYSYHLFIYKLEYWRFFLTHLTIIFGYLFVYLYWFDEMKFDAKLIYISFWYTTIFGLFIESFNLCFDTTFVFVEPARIFLKTNNLIYCFLISLFEYPLLIGTGYLILFFSKNFYNTKIIKVIRYLEYKV